MKLFAKHIGLTVLVAGLVGAIVVATGLVPIKASSGHWPVTRWFLDFAKSRSVSTHSIAIQAPDLDKQHLVIKGAGIYEMNCSWCHGSPALRSPRIMAAATPAPPYLVEKIDKYEPKELFYITKHGIKFTGMPAWPAENRDDEVWAVTAFLLKLPELNEEDYLRMAQGVSADDRSVSMEKPGPPESPPRNVTATCAMCHGDDGAGRGLGAFPKLAGQKHDYLLNSLLSFRDGHRPSGAMEPIAAKLSDAEIEELAGYYSKLPVKTTATVDLSDDRSESLQIGEQIATNGIPDQRIPSCIDCHALDVTTTNPNYPIIAGQYAEYLQMQLDLFAKGHRGGSDYYHVMNESVDDLSHEQMRNVAAWFAGQSAAQGHRDESREANKKK